MHTKSFGLKGGFGARFYKLQQANTSVSVSHSVLSVKLQKIHISSLCVLYRERAESWRGTGDYSNANWQMERGKDVWRKLVWLKLRDERGIEQARWNYLHNEKMEIRIEWVKVIGGLNYMWYDIAGEQFYKFQRI